MPALQGVQTAERFTDWATFAPNLWPPAVEKAKRGGKRADQGVTDGESGFQLMLGSAVLPGQG